MKLCVILHRINFPEANSDLAPAAMLGGLVKQREFLLARASKHPKRRARWRRMLGDDVRRTYVGDARGLLYWRRVAKVIWIAYENLLRLNRSQLRRTLI